MRRYLAAAVAALVSCTLGCSSAYMPQPGPRVSVLMAGGTIAYVRDGKKYEGGLFGGDIEEAVRGNPQAEEYAQEYKSGVVTGFAAMMLGIAGVVGGVVVTGLEEGPRANSGSVPVAGLVILGAGAVLDIVGATVMTKAVSHLWDAINSYNDGLTPP
jgi:hypothetical protein